MAPQQPRFSYPLDELRNFASDVLARAREKGASACELEVSEGFSQSVSVRRNEVENIEIGRAHV